MQTKSLMLGTYVLVFYFSVERNIQCTLNCIVCKFARSVMEKNKAQQKGQGVLEADDLVQGRHGEPIETTFE